MDLQHCAMPEDHPTFRHRVDAWFAKHRIVAGLAAILLFVLFIAVVTLIGEALGFDMSEGEWV